MGTCGCNHSHRPVDYRVWRSPMACLICGQNHAAEAPCPTVIRQPGAGGTAVMGSDVALGLQMPPSMATGPASPVPPGPAPIASPAPQPQGLSPSSGSDHDPLVGSTIGSFRIV